MVVACENCGAPAQPGVVRCGYCGQAVSAELARNAIPCPRCGELNVWGAQRCVRCQFWVVVQCVFCGGISPCNLAACMHCNEPFAGAPERKAALDAQAVQVAAERDLFPLCGFTIGRTTKAELLRYPGAVEKSGYCWIEGIDFWYHDGEVFEHLYMTYTDPMPMEWVERLGFEWRLSYKDWLKLLAGEHFRVSVGKPPSQGDFKGKTVFQAQLVATRGRPVPVEVELEFDYEPGSETSSGTLYSIRVRSP